MNLSANIDIRKVKNHTAAGTTDVESDAVDLQNYDGVVFFTTIAVANAGNYIKAQQDENDDSAFGDAEDLAGSKIVTAAANNVAWLDVYRPHKRYIRLHVERTESTAVGEIYALRYNGRIKPDTNLVTNHIIGDLLISPDAGTA